MSGLEGRLDVLAAPRPRPDYRAPMTAPQPNNPLHGITLEAMLREMVEHSGWDGLARDLPIRCFLVEPSMTSALKYLRKAPRARQKLEEVYLGFRARRARDERRRDSK